MGHCEALIQGLPIRVPKDLLSYEPKISLLLYSRNIASQLILNQY